MGCDVNSLCLQTLLRAMAESKHLYSRTSSLRDTEAGFIFPREYGVSLTKRIHLP